MESCDETKPDDSTYEMVYPWLSTERIFSEGEEPPLSSYQQTYDHLFNKHMGKAFSIILLNSQVCMARCLALTDVRFLADRDRLKRILSQCMSEPIQDVPMIAIYTTLVWIGDMKVLGTDEDPISGTSYRSSFPRRKTAFTCKMLAHANMIIVDRTNKTVERFEPNELTHMGREQSVRYEEMEYIMEHSIMTLFRGKGYTYCPPLSFCPKGGPQDDQMCAAWSFFYLHLRLMNPLLSRKEIAQRMNLMRYYGNALIDYLEVMKNTQEALESGSGVYRDDQRQTFKELSRDVRSDIEKRILDISLDTDRYLSFLYSASSYYRDKKREVLYWIYIIQGKALWTGVKLTKYIEAGEIMR